MGEDLFRGEGPDLGGREFDRERDPIEAARDLGDGLELGVVDHDRAVCGQRALGEEPDAFGSGTVDAERRDREAVLSGDLQRFTRRREDPELGCRGQQTVEELGGDLDDLLAVVDDEECRLLVQVCREVFVGGTVGRN